MQPERLVETSALDDGLSVFVSVRPRLFGIAYRMLGSAAEAEDIVQDVWLRWQSTNRSVAVTLAWIETNGQAAVLVSRDGVPVALTTVNASAQGIDQIMWFLRPSKLVGISKSGQRLSDVPGPAAA